MRRFLLSLIVLFVFSSSSALADTNIQTSADISYTFDASGRSLVNQTVTLTNGSTHLYATSYKLVLEGENAQDISAFEAGKKLDILVKQTSDQSQELEIYFPSPVVGKANSRTFTISYSGNPAHKKGQMWEIVLPGIKDEEFFDNYRIKITIPQEFGRPAYINPDSYSSSGNSYIFTKSGLSAKGIYAIFGNFQTYDFRLVYHLENTSKKTVTRTVALPPDTASQKVFYQSMSPKPSNVNYDRDGNWLADIVVKPKSYIAFTVTGQFHILPGPSTISLIPSSDQLKKYLLPQEYWPVSDTGIKALSSTYTTPQSIHNYVVGLLDYDPASATSSSGRKGALKVLADPTSSLCTDYTDLYISLARSAGIPTREIQGYAYSSDDTLFSVVTYKNLLHSWPEYWDDRSKTWVSIDPAWSDTSKNIDYFSQFDTNHIAFAIHGESSSSPLPAGLYSGSTSQKDVFIELGDYKDFHTGAPQVSWQKPKLILPFIKNKMSFTLTNNSPQAVYWYPVSISLSPFMLQSTQEFNIAVIPPSGHIDIPIEFSVSPLPDFSPKYVSLRLGDSIVTYNIPNHLLLFWYVTVSIIISVLFISLVWPSVHTWSLYLQRRRR